MRLAPIAFIALSLLAGCRRAGAEPFDPNNPDLLAPCPSGAPHLAVGLRASAYDSEQVLLRFTTDFEQCQGTIVSSATYGTISTVSALPDGTDVVGFLSGYGRDGSIVLFDGTNELGTIEAEGVAPISIAPLTFEGSPAFVVVWGDSSSSSATGERIDVYSTELALLGSWDVPWEITRATAPITNLTDRIAAWDAGNGLQEFRSDPGATSLATTGELQIAQPSATYSATSLDVVGSNVRTATAKGVLYWRSGLAPAFLGPVHCRYPVTGADVLPDGNESYEHALVDRDAPEEASLVLVRGVLEGASESTSEIYVLGHRGDCRQMLSIPSTHHAVGMAWSGER
jgi:hypothetical protein